MSSLPQGVPPQNPFPLLPLRNGVLLPGTTITLPMGRAQSVELVKAVKPGDVIGVAVQREPQTQDPTLADLLPVGVFARVTETFRTPGGLRMVLEGLARFRLTDLTRHTPYWTAEGELLADTDVDGTETEALEEALRREVAALPAVRGTPLETLRRVPDDAEGPSLLADRVASGLQLETEKELEVLLAQSVKERLRVVLRLLAGARAAQDVRHKIESEVRGEFQKNQKEAILREQLKAIRRELGEEGDAKDDLAVLKKRLEDAGLPEEARKTADRELRRLEGMGGQSPEANVIRSYLDWLAAVPWSKRAPANDDLRNVREKLEGDHHGLEDVKRRILEHLAVIKRTGSTRATVLCLAGPPGVGKTSLGQSIADAMGRPFVRVALGGVRDEAEIRGHRRTYVAAMPGRIMHAMKKAGVKNPVFLLDEIDKLGQGWMGSPESALLEVLDPEQNKTFQDHFLELPYDLSEVLFICTANDLSALSAPLRDRLEIIELSGYTMEEKFHIARNHLIPRALKDHALGDGMLTVTDAALRGVINGYTREAGVRQLNRELVKLCRALTLEMEQLPADTKPAPRVVDEDGLKKPLGKVRFFNDVAERTASPGVATGLAWTPMGGDILFIETSRMPGKGRLEITGQLGDVMKESARAALTYVRSHAVELGVKEDFMEKEDVHIHVPAGGVPKDGPSAGVTMFTALTSLFSGRRVRADTAMTGECTLRGKVLPVGGIKEKVLAAHRAGLTRVILPKKNERDLDDVPATVREQMTFFPAEDMATVLRLALEDVPATAPHLDDAPLAGPPATVVAEQVTTRPEHLA